MADIIIFSNVERQYQRLEQAHILLAKEGILQPGCRSLFFSSSSVWDGAAEKEIKDAKAVYKRQLSLALALAGSAVSGHKTNDRTAGKTALVWCDHPA